MGPEPYKPIEVRLRKVKCDPEMYKDSHVFTAEVMVDGKLMGTVRNDGNGGGNLYYSLADSGRRELQQILHQDAMKRDPYMILSGEDLMWLTPDLDDLVDHELTIWLVKRDQDKAARHRWLFTLGSSPGLYARDKGLRPDMSYRAVKAVPDRRVYNDETTAGRLAMIRELLAHDEKKSLAEALDSGKEPINKRPDAHPKA